MPEVGRIWIQGAGELASGVAWRLRRCGYRVVMAEVCAPLAVRRRVVFCEAVYEGRIEVEGMVGHCVAAEEAAFHSSEIIVCVDPEAGQLRRLAPEAVIDARMTKRRPQALPTIGAPVIGLGPGFCCGRDATLVVETHRGARLGALIEQGEAAPNTGVPGRIGGVASRRLLRAPTAGHLEAKRRIGDLVQEGDVVATVAGEAVRCGIDGILRGLIHPRAELFAGMKVGDIDPRGSAVDPGLISDKALAVAGGVLEGLLRLGIGPGAPERRSTS